MFTKLFGCWHDWQSTRCKIGFGERDFTVPARRCRKCGAAQRASLIPFKLRVDFLQSPWVAWSGKPLRVK